MPLSSKFPTGAIVATPGALKAFHDAGAEPATYLKRHLSGDWGDADAHDTKANNDALKRGGRLLSAYKLPDKAKTVIWIITEADRSATTFLLPEEY